MLLVFARNIAFFAGSLLAVLVGLTVIDEDVLRVEKVLTLITILGVLFSMLSCDNHLLTFSHFRHVLTFTVFLIIENNELGSD